MEADLQDANVDLSAGVLRSRSWRWLQVRILGLLSRPSLVVFDGRGRPHGIPQTRLAWALDPPTLAPDPQASDDEGEDPDPVS